jgi:3-isopropylmalate/(R)-2-methylmalate dehydratase large subunit
MGGTYFDAVWDAHVVEHLPDGNDLLAIDQIVAHEITTPPAIGQLEREFGGALYDASAIVAVNDHVSPAKDAATALQAQSLRTWAKRNAIPLYDVGDNGICHVLVPERGLVVPGSTVVCGDSHTCTLGAIGALAIGVGTTVQAGAMLAGCAIFKRPQTLEVRLTGRRARRTSAKDVALAYVRALGAAGGAGYALEFTGDALAAFGVDERLTLCNMAVEAGATTAIVQPDAVTQAYLRDRGGRDDEAERWSHVQTNAARYAQTIELDVASIEPAITWGTNPAQTSALDGYVPANAPAEALAYMGLHEGQPLAGLEIDQVFIGSCTNSRLTDLRAAATLFRGRRVRVPTIVTPGSQRVKREAEREGLHDVFQDAGALWTHSSCGPCLGMSMGVLAPGMRCVSTSNRNFPGRMGAGGRVHLASPVVAAAAAVLGHIPSGAALEALLEEEVCA